MSTLRGDKFVTILTPKVNLNYLIKLLKSY